MRFGMNVVNFGTTAEPDHLTTWATTIEDLGYDFLMVCDHVAMTDDVYNRYPTPFYDPVITLGYFAGITTRVRLGTTVLVIPYRQPLLVARMFANLDQLSHGRMILGVGIGGPFPDEFDALGAEYHRRGAVSDDYLRVIKEAWGANETEVVGRSGRRLRAHNEPLPYNGHSIPIWVGGNTDFAIKRTLALGAIWHPIRPKIGWLESDGLPRLREAAERAGAPLPLVAPRISLDISKSTLRDDERVVGQGTVEQIRSDIAALEAIGVEEVLFDTAPRRDLSFEEHIEFVTRGATEIADLKAP